MGVRGVRHRGAGAGWSHSFSCGQWGLCGAPPIRHKAAEQKKNMEAVHSLLGPSLHWYFVHRNADEETI